MPTQIIIADTTWDVLASQLSINPDTTMDVRNFQNSEPETVYQSRAGFPKRKWYFVGDMNDLNIDSHYGKLKGISINGERYGQVDVYSLLKKPVFDAKYSLKMQD